MHIMVLAVAAAAVLGGSAPAVGAQPDPPANPAAVQPTGPAAVQPVGPPAVQAVRPPVVKTAERTPPTIRVTCTGPVFGTRSDSVNIGDISSSQNEPVRNLINNQSVTSFTFNCGNEFISGVMTTGNGLVSGGTGAFSGACTGCT